MDKDGGSPRLTSLVLMRLMLKNLAFFLVFGAAVAVVFTVLPQAWGQVRQGVMYAMGLGALAFVVWRHGRQRR